MYGLINFNSREEVAELKQNKLLMAILLVGVAASSAVADEWKFKGNMFGDYYYVASADDADTILPEKRNAFQFRRLYFTAEKALSDDFSVRYRLEASDAGFGSGDRMKPFVKHGYLKWKKGLGNSDLYLGLTGTPIWAVSEELWGYRAIEKTVLDVNNIGSSADLGVGLKGKAGGLNYHLMVGNGPGKSPEDDNGKKFYGSGQFNLSESLVVEGYADFNMRPGGQNQLTFKGFVGLKQKKLSGGIEAFTRINKAAGKAKKVGDDVIIAGISAFGSLELSGQWKGFGRLDAVSDNDEDATDLLIIAGIDRSVGEDVHLMPNLYVQLPDGPDPNIQVRLTFYYKY